MEFIGSIVIVLGALVFATAGLALIRFPDAYTHISAIGTAGGIGIVLVVSGVLLHSPNLTDFIKVIIIIVLQLSTSAIGAMAIARSAYLTHTPLRRAHFDELADITRERAEAGENDDSAELHEATPPVT